MHTYAVDVFIIPLCGILSWKFIHLIEYFVKQLHISSDYHTGKLHLFSSPLMNHSDKLHWTSVTDRFLQPIQTSLHGLFAIIVCEL